MRTIFLMLTVLSFLTLLPESTLAADATCRRLEATIVGTDDDDVLDGTPGPDVIAGLRGHDVINGFDGDDVICAGAGRDTVNGGNGNDLVRGQRGVDMLDAGSGDDDCLGGRGEDLIVGCEAPGPATEHCSNCPCPFFDVPMTDGCWPDPEFRPNRAHGKRLCSLVPGNGYFGYALGVSPESICFRGSESIPCCSVFFDETPYPGEPCDTPLDVFATLSAEHLEDCRTCLEDYALALNDVGIAVHILDESVVTTGPPYVCTEP